jgi:FkbM family methyltransferase
MAWIGKCTLELRAFMNEFSRAATQYSKPSLVQLWIDTLLVAFRYRTPYFRGKGRIYAAVRRLSKHRPLTIRYGQGSITLTEGEYIPNQIIEHGFCEREVWDAIKLIAERDEVFWDIGANIGSVSILALTDPSVSEVHSFEPDVDVARMLEVNLRNNAVGNKLYKVHTHTVGDFNGVVTFYKGHTSNVNSADRDWGFGQTEVQCLTIDEIVERKLASQPTLLKIDVEGWDTRVIYGATNTLSVAPPKCIVFEAECTLVGNIIDENLIPFLASKGYSVHHIMRPSGRIDINSITGTYLENYIAVLKSHGMARLVL